MGSPNPPPPPLDPERFAAALCYLRDSAGLPDLEALLATAAAGDRRAFHQLRELSVALSLRPTWKDWSRPDDIDPICRMFATKLAAIEEGLNHVGAVAVQDATMAAAPSEFALNSEASFAGDIIRLVALPSLPTAGICSNAATSGSNLPSSVRRRFAIASLPPKWRDLAKTAGFPYKRLPRSLQEILDVLDRVLVARRGWGPRDSARLTRESVEYQPAKLSKHGCHFSKRTYERGRVRLLELGLIRIAGKNKFGAFEIAPAWWPAAVCPDAVEVWRQAARQLASTEEARHPGAPLSLPEPQNVIRLSPSPVRGRRRPIRNHDRELSPFLARHRCQRS